MKKILSLLLSLAMVFSLAGCSTKTGGADSRPDSTVSSVVEHSSQPADSSETEDVSSQAPASSSQATPQSSPAPVSSQQQDESKPAIDEDGHFFDKKNVALYIHTYGHLPENFITKDEARDLGWEGGSVEKYAPGYAIGGDRFGNYEGQLPKKKGRTYYECDIDTDGYHSRGSRRIVFSNDGLIYYTHDHYENFELLYGEE